MRRRTGSWKRHGILYDGRCPYLSAARYSSVHFLITS